MALDSILLVGCGNMAGAMLHGWLAAGRSPDSFAVIDPGRRDLPEGVRALDSANGERFDAVLLGVKPQLLDAVAGDVAAVADSATVLISMLAGVNLAILAERFPDAGGIVRIMPNLAVSVGKSPIAMAESGLDDAGRRNVHRLLEPLGTPEWIAEDEFDLVTALAGSGPAFVYRVIDALAVAAASLGLPEDKAGRLALAMVDGAATLAAASPYSPGELARRVASPGGTTQAGLDAIDQDDALVELMKKTLRAARDRSAEMTAEAQKE